MSDTVTTASDRQDERADSTSVTQSSELECPECGCSAVYRNHERGERCCDRCGLVIEGSMLDTGPEWRAFDASEREEKSRVGAPVTRTLHDKGLTTAISWQDRDGNGRTLSSKRREQMRRQIGRAHV